MAFELPTQPNYNVAPPQVQSPLEQYGKMLQLRALSGQIQNEQQMQPLQQQEAQQDVQAKTLQNQQAQLKIQSQQATIKAFSDADFLKSSTGTDAAQSNGLGFDPDAMTKGLIAKGVLPEDAMAISSHYVDRAQKQAETAKAIAQTGEANASIRGKGFDALHDRVADVVANPDGAAPLLYDLVHHPELFAGVPSDDISHVRDALVTENAAKLKAVGGSMDIDKKIADTQQKQADAKQAQQKVIPDGLQMSPDAQQQLQKDIAVATNAEIQKGKEAVATAEGQARVNLEASMARGSQAALAKVPPHLIGPATEGAIKAGTEYAQAKSVSDRLTAMVDAAKNGNVVSYQLIPEEGALQVTTSQGVNRINMAEIENYGGGSLWQRMQGHIGKTLTGASIPKSVLDDMSEMQKIQSEGSRVKYENSLKTINQATGAAFEPVKMDPMAAKPKTNPTAPGTFSWDAMPQHQ